MAENEKPKTDYQSNSAKSKKDHGETVERPEIKQIASATVRKKGLGAKFRDTFAGDSAESVFQYVLFDIVVPRAKDLLFEMISGGSERALFGSSTRSSRASRGNRSRLVDKTDYKGLSESGSTRRERDISPRGRASHNFEEILIPTRGEAEQVLDTLLALIDQYDSATVADLYSTVGISTDHTDLKFGWTDLTEARIEPARGGGYILELPRAETL